MNINDFIGENTKVSQIIGNRDNGVGALYEFSPGNGLIYRIVAIKVESLDLGILGSVEPGWLIYNGNNGRSHLFASQGYLSAGYVTEKLYRDGKDDHFSIDEIQCMTALIGYATNRETSVQELHLKT